MVYLIKLSWNQIFIMFDKVCKGKKMPKTGIEPVTFRSSVWRSPNWAISACFWKGSRQRRKITFHFYRLIIWNSQKRLFLLKRWKIAKNTFYKFLNTFLDKKQRFVIASFFKINNQIHYQRFQFCPITLPIKTIG